MNAQPSPRLTERERDNVREQLFQAKRKDFLFMQEIVAESKSWHDAYAKNDLIEMGRALDAVLWLHLEAHGYFKEAEDDLLASKDINGKSWLMA